MDVNVEHTQLGMASKKDSHEQSQSHKTLSLASCACDYAVDKADEWSLG